MVNLSFLSKLYNSMYDCYFTVSSFKSILNNDGTVGRKEKITKYQDKRCRISRINQDGQSKNSDERKIDHNVLGDIIKIFCDIDIVVNKGDEIVATRVDSTGKVIASFIGIAEKPFIYESHQEIIIHIRDGD